MLSVNAAASVGLNELKNYALLPLSVNVLENESKLLDAQKDDMESQYVELSRQISRYDDLLDNLDGQDGYLEHQTKSLYEQKNEVLTQILQQYGLLDVLPDETEENEEQIALIQAEIWRQIKFLEKNLESLDMQDDYLRTQRSAVPEQRDDYQRQIVSAKKQWIVLRNQIDAIAAQKQIITDKIQHETTRKAAGIP